MSWVIAAIVLALLVTALVWAWRRAGSTTGPPRPQPWEDGASRTRGTVVLDLEVRDPDHPSVRRLVREAAHRALAADPSLDRVEVRDPSGGVLGSEERPGPLPPAVDLPAALREPHGPRSHTPSPVGHDDPARPGGVHGAAPEIARIPLADRLDLSPDIRARVVDPTRAVDVVRAILEAGGHQVTVDGDLLVTGDVAIVVVDPRSDPDRALTHGFLRVQEARVPRGLVLRLGYVDPAIVRRREAAAPHVRHVGPDALQRMADAVAAGGDPVAFAAGPVLLR